MTSLLETLTPTIKKQFSEIFQDNLISLIVFGSQARGDATPESDIDILVVLKDKKQKQTKREQIIDFITEISLEFGVLISCIYANNQDFETEKSPLMLNVRREGIPL
ncbi:hypothetical protein AWQ21_02260 [Picosynechococcus sp. PCC 7003]|uniref:nucleotidyltransferase domain-containing protein n=1 Tax=Picosynechococcus sp. PCC 7003 TaxID=374981 RepID=UPI000810A6BB|nr:nucleotidyltransferase domain-containing protein [Picosynechococcus sp. PCC 7003]ANV83303.1 hypothetical protein AWQ21_02260 [Picosynechococcus sp. PCC 7003]